MLHICLVGALDSYVYGGVLKYTRMNPFLTSTVPYYCFLIYSLWSLIYYTPVSVHFIATHADHLLSVITTTFSWLRVSVYYTYLPVYTYKVSP